MKRTKPNCTKCGLPVEGKSSVKFSAGGIRGVVHFDCFMRNTKTPDTLPELAQRLTAGNPQQQQTPTEA